MKTYIRRDSKPVEPQNLDRRDPATTTIVNANCGPATPPPPSSNHVLFIGLDGLFGHMLRLSSSLHLSSYRALFDHAFFQIRGKSELRTAAFTGMVGAPDFWWMGS
ncbi:MAG: hypothetical protein H7Y43_08675 [Akkermansiaceae bacterium]|nr:hypothetical protein [Verrucomicrobiales bacterium]